MPAAPFPGRIAPSSLSEAEDEAVHASRRLDCRVAGIDHATHDIRILSLDIESGGPFDFTAGQYAALAFPRNLPPRDFSMASPPGAARLEFHVRLVAGGQVTRHVMNTLRVGDRVSVNGPMGTAHYRKSHRGPVLLVAGGSGLAPIKSIAESALAGGAGQDMFLYFGARAERDVYLEEHFAALAARHPNLRTVTVLSESDAPTRRRTGWLADALAADFDEPRRLQGLSRRSSRDGGNLYRKPARAGSRPQGLPCGRVLY